MKFAIIQIQILHYDSYIAERMRQRRNRKAILQSLDESQDFQLLCQKYAKEGQD